MPATKLIGVGRGRSQLLTVEVFKEHYTEKQVLSQVERYAQEKRRISMFSYISPESNLAFYCRLLAPTHSNSETNEPHIYYVLKTKRVWSALVFCAKSRFRWYKIRYFVVGKRFTDIYCETRIRYVYYTLTRIRYVNLVDRRQKYKTHW